LFHFLHLSISLLLTKLCILIFVLIKRHDLTSLVDTAPAIKQPLPRIKGQIHNSSGTPATLPKFVQFRGFARSLGHQYPDSDLTRRTNTIQVSTIRIITTTTIGAYNSSKILLNATPTKTSISRINITNRGRNDDSYP
ncbi:hypothetical protein BGZ92_003757, partial [Podila epicladia]